MKVLGVVGRVIFGLAFLAFGIVHLIMGAKFSGEVPNFFQFGLTGFWVYLTGVAYILAGISIIIDIGVAISCALLGVLVFLIAFTIHLPGFIYAPNDKMMVAQIANFIKAMAIGSAAWYIAGTLGGSGIVTDYGNKSTV